MSVDGLYPNVGQDSGGSGRIGMVLNPVYVLSALLGIFGTLQLSWPLFDTNLGLGPMALLVALQHRTEIKA